MLKRKKIFSYVIASAIMMNTFTPYVALAETNDKNKDSFDQQIIKELSDSEEVVIAVIGGGFDVEHPDIKDKLYTNEKEIPGNSIDDDNNGLVDDVSGWNFNSNSNVISEDKVRESSNTSVTASIIKSIDDIQKQLGEDVDIKILPVRFTGNNVSNNDLVKAIKYAESMGANIAHCLFNSYTYSQAVYETILNSNMLFVAASGDQRDDIDGVDKVYPAAYKAPNIISVASTDAYNNISKFAGYGKKNVDLGALGENKILPRAIKGEKTAAIFRETNTYKTLFHGFGYEQLEKSDRNKLMQQALDKFGMNKDSKILLIEDDQGADDVGPVYKEVLDELSINYDAKDISGDLSEETLNPYDLVIWVGGYGLGNIAVPQAENSLKNYLDNGGNLYVMGQEIGTYGYDTSLFRDYMDVKFVSEDYDRVHIDDKNGEKFNFSNEERLRQTIDYIAPLRGKSSEFLVYGAETKEEAYTNFTSTNVAASEVTAVAATLVAKGVVGFDNVKRIILDNVEKSPSLVQVTSTSGVLDLDKALENIEKIDNNQIPGEKLNGNTVTRTIGEDGDNIDIYRVLLKKDDKVMLMTRDLEYPSKGMDLDLYLYGPDATKIEDEGEIVVKSNKDNTSDEYIGEYKVKESGYHYIVVRNQGEQGEYSMMMYTNNQQNKEIQVDDNSGEIEYYGKWNTINSWDHSNGNLHQLNSEGKATFKFTGSKFKLYATKDANQGKMGIMIDGNPVKELSLYSKEKKTQQLVYEKELGYGDHTVEFFWINQNDPNGKDEATSINIDHIVYNNTVSDITKPDLFEPLTYGYIEQVVLGIYHKYDQNIKSYKVYRSEDDGKTYKQLATVPTWNNDLITYVDDFKDTNIQDKEYLYKVIGVDRNDVESKESIAKARPLIANSKYFIENDSNHIEYKGKWETVKAIKGGDSGNTTTVTAENRASIKIPLTGYAMDIYLDTGDYAGNASVKVNLVSESQGVEISTDERFSNGAGNYRINITSAISDGPITDGYVEIINDGGTFGIDKVEILDIDNGVAPQYPTDLNGIRTDKGVELKWTDNKEADVKGYDIYRSEQSGIGYSKINNELVNSNSYIDKTADPAKTYYYHIRAKDYANHQSHPSGEISVSTDLTEVPNPSVGFSVLGGDDRFDTAVKVSQEGWKLGANDVVLVSANALADGLTATPFAAAKDAPMLLTNIENIPKSTKDELSRLKAKNVYIVGGEAVVNKAVEKELKDMGLNVTRISGRDRYATSLEIAQYIDEIKDVSNVYITGGNAEPDALSIAPKAGEEQNPIILVEENNVPLFTYTWLKGEKLTDAYVIGGESKVSNDVLAKVNSITSNDISKNRVAGVDRQSTNAEVIKKFYKTESLDSAFVTKSDVLVDALTSGPLAAKYKAPVVIATEELNSDQEKLLVEKEAKSVYQVGKGIGENVINKIKQLLK